jgi:F0F1-type ATP synthase membrane subunit b/b'
MTTNNQPADFQQHRIRKQGLVSFLDQAIAECDEAIASAEAGKAKLDEMLAELNAKADEALAKYPLL